MAFRNPGQSAALQAAVDYAWSHGVVVVAAAGNDGSSDADATRPVSPRSSASARPTQGDAVASFSNQSAACSSPRPASASPRRTRPASPRSPARRPRRRSSPARPRCCAPTTRAARRRRSSGGWLATRTPTTGGSRGNGRVEPRPRHRRHIDRRRDACGRPRRRRPGRRPVRRSRQRRRRHNDGLARARADRSGQQPHRLHLSPRRFLDVRRRLADVVHRSRRLDSAADLELGHRASSRSRKSGSGTNSCDPGTASISGSGPWTVTIPQTCGNQRDHLTIVYSARALRRPR